MNKFKNIAVYGGGSWGQWHSVKLLFLLNYDRLTIYQQVYERYEGNVCSVVSSV